MGNNLPPEAYTPAYVPVINYMYGMPYQGNKAGQQGEMGTLNTTGPAFAPQTQLAKAATLGVDMAVDVARGRGLIEPGQPYPDAGDPAPAAPTITSLAPNTAAAGSISPLAVTITGTGFTQWSQVITGNVFTDMFEYVSPTEIKLLMDPARSVAGITEVRVVDHGATSAASNFTFT